MKIHHKILSLALSIVSLLTMFSVSAQASTLPTSVPSLWETYLSNQQAIGDTSLVLANGTLRDGTTFTGYQCVTIDSNTPTTEYECGMASGTVMTFLTRGIAAVDGVSTSSSLIFAHRRGADVKVSDYPVLTQLDRIANGIDTFPNTIMYASNIGTSSLQANSQNLATIGYVNNTAFSGAGVVNGTTGAKGVIQIATPAQAAAGTSLGSSGASLALTSAIASSTASTTASIVVVASSSTGRIDPSFISGSTLSNINLTGTTTLSGSPISSIGKNYIVATTPGNGSTTLPGGTLFCAIVTGGGGAGGSSNSGSTYSGGGGGAGGTSEGCYTLTGTTTISYIVGASGIGIGTSTLIASVATGTLTMVGNPGVNGASNVNNTASQGSVGGMATGGLINIQGGSGSDGIGSTLLMGGSGGASIWGSGGAGGGSQAGSAGNPYGSGGGGGSNVGNGGNGAQGVVIIYY